MTEKIIGVYKITNTITGDFYIGSSKDVKQRLAVHKCQSTWKKCPNNPMYIDMKHYGTDKFSFQILEEVEPESLKETEQKFIETLKPTYNSIRANGWDLDKYKEYYKEYQKSDKCKEHHNKYYSQLCCYNGQTLTLNALALRFYKAGIEHPTKEAKKYLLKKESKNAIEFYDIYP